MRLVNQRQSSEMALRIEAMGSAMWLSGWKALPSSLTISLVSRSYMVKERTVFCEFSSDLTHTVICV